MKVQQCLLGASWGRMAAAVLGLAGLGLISESNPRLKPEITLTAQAVPLSTRDGLLGQVGALRFLGGLALRSGDPRFGGLSGLSVEARDGGWEILAVTDQGDRVTGRLVFEGERLRSVDFAALEPLVDTRRRPLAGKLMGDAESLTRLPDGRVLVGFERRHRIWAYGRGLTGPATAFPTPQGIEDAPANGGLESIASWPDGRILAITEQMKAKDGNYRGFLFERGVWSKLEWKPSTSGFVASDATVIPGGDLLVLERYWSALDPLGVASRMIRVKGDTVRPGATLAGELVAELRAPLTAENFEGIAAFTKDPGKLNVLIVSDDNFSGAQRTLLFLFEMADASERAPVKP